jgi:homoserine dehydrogenase
MQNSRIVLIGHGNVGTALVRLLSEIDPKGRRFVFSGIATRKLGIIELGNVPAPEVDSAIHRVLAERRTRDLKQTDPKEIIHWLETWEYDVLVEVTDSNYADAEPALSYLKTALRRGKDAVTANKAPIAIALKDLRTLAARTGARIRFESTVMDGTPLFSLFTESMPPVRIRRMRGILNSTSNIVLDFLNQNRSLKEGLAKAKSLGLTESDPMLDLNGFDAAAKLTIIANAINDADIKMSQVMIQPLTEQNFAAVRSLSASKGRDTIIRQVAVADFDKNFYRVSLEALKQDDPLYSCNGSSNMIAFSLDLFTELIIASRNPTLRDTAFGIYSDLMHLQHTVKR